MRVSKKFLNFLKKLLDKDDSWIRIVMSQVSEDSRIWRIYPCSAGIGS